MNLKIKIETFSAESPLPVLLLNYNKKNIKIIAYTKTSAGSARFRVGNGSLDSGNNYASRISSNGGSEDVTTSISGNSYTATTPIQWDMEITNIANEEKLWISHLVRQSTAGAGTAPSRVEEVIKWVNTSNQIDTVGFVCTDGSGTFSSDSYITVFGASGDVTSDTTPDGTIWEESDTGKHYIWNATSDTWSEIA